MRTEKPPVIPLEEILEDPENFVAIWSFHIDPRWNHIRDEIWYAPRKRILDLMEKSHWILNDLKSRIMVPDFSPFLEIPLKERKYHVGSKGTPKSCVQQIVHKHPDASYNRKAKRYTWWYLTPDLVREISTKKLILDQKIGKDPAGSSVE